MKSKLVPVIVIPVLCLFMFHALYEVCRMLSANKTSAKAISIIICVIFVFMALREEKHA